MQPAALLLASQSDLDRRTNIENRRLQSDSRGMGGAGTGPLVLLVPIYLAGEEPVSARFAKFALCSRFTQAAMLVALLALSAAEPAFAGNKKTFVREYTYAASDDDSKNSSRRKALEQLRVELLREIGVYIESYLEIATVAGETEREFVREEIRTTTAGITETKLVDERWDGREYSVKAEVAIDTRDVIRKINKSLENRASSKELKRMRKLLEQSNAESQARTVEVLELRELLTDRNQQIGEQERRLADLDAQFRKAEQELSAVTARRRVVKTRLDAIRSQMDHLAEVALEAFHPGLTHKEFSQLVGEKPRAKRSCRSGAAGRKVGDYSDEAENYGSVWVIFDDESGMTKAVTAYDPDAASPCHSKRLR